jgi:cellulose synthase/poly-beta-1,6-N-acetylglucosamine synthase-like glycosyltransferase
MLWLFIPVIIYSAGLLALMLISILRRKKIHVPHIVQCDDGEAVSSITGHKGAAMSSGPGNEGEAAWMNVAATAGLPAVSVVVAARNEEKTITALLDSLARQDWPPELLEIIIVNDNSTDRTPIVVSGFIASWVGTERNSEGNNGHWGIAAGVNTDGRGASGEAPHGIYDGGGHLAGGSAEGFGSTFTGGYAVPRIRLVYNPYGGKKNAVRYGIGKATGDVILTTDADCVAGREWVRSHARWYAGYHQARACPAATDDSEDGMEWAGAGLLPDPATGPGQPSGPFSRHQGLMDGRVKSAGLPGAACMKDMVLGPVFQRPVGGFWSLFGVIEFSALQAVTEAAAQAGHPVMCNAANMSFRRDVYLRHADELRPDLVSGDDMFLLHAVMHDGGAVMHDGSSAAAVETAAAATAAALVHQRARWASKTFHYRDAATLTLAAATAACNAAVAAATVASVISVKFIPAAAAMFALKAVPDLLLATGEMKKRGTKAPFIPLFISVLLYPFYSITVAVLSQVPSFRRFQERR